MSSVPLLEVCDYSEASTSVEDLTLSNFISTDNMMQNRGGIVDAVNLPPAASCCKFDEDEILLSNIRPYFKKIWYSTFDGGCSNDVLVLKTKNKKFHPKFVYYSLFQDLFFKHMMNGAKGSKMPRGDKDQIMLFQIPEFEKNYQEKIADYLSLLDEKISLNNRINTELEAMAKAIYNYWFVQFDSPNEEGKPYKTSGGEMEWNEELKSEIPKGWEVGTLSDVVEIKYGKDHKHLEEGKIPVYGSGGIMRYANKALYESESILIPRKGTLNNLFYLNKPFWSVDTMFYTKMKQSHIGKYLFYLIQSFKLASLNVGSAVPSMTADVLNAIFLIIPPKDVLKNFDEIVSPKYELIEHNIKQTQELITLRDFLLPLLMNGQVKVK